MRRLRRSAAWFSVLPAALAAWWWFAPSGTGEYADSPDGRYRASAGNYRRGTWFHGRARYVGIEIIDRSTGAVVWRAEHSPPQQGTTPEYGDRSKKFVRWASDSQTVAIPVGAQADSVWSVP